MQIGLEILIQEVQFLGTYFYWAILPSRGSLNCSQQLHYRQLKQNLVFYQECLWLRKFLESIRYKQAEPTIIKEDNQSCIQYVYAISVRYNFIKESIKDESTVVEYCSTNDMVSNIFTKPLIRLISTNIAMHWECQMLLEGD
jgi:isopentenyldiphosphate isomerase